MTEFLIPLFQDFVFAALAGVGFALAANPPLRIVPMVAVFAGLGHALRFGSAEWGQISVSTGSLLAGFAVGICSVIAAMRMRIPAEYFAFPSLLPMIPGMYAYKAILSLLNFVEADNLEAKEQWLILTADNGSVALLVVCALGAGALIPIMLLQHTKFFTTRSGARNAESRKAF
ncbi:MAG: threonine/serine exporter family protein [Desulfovibrio sp.]|nr:threonine/serine exporter family protein [Desulfovibrio sp.]